MEKLLELKEFLLSKKYYMIGGLIFIILLAFSIYFSFKKLDNDKAEEVVFLEKEKEEIVIDKEECYVSVDIKGEVKLPGLYKINCESRVQDVINKAGGITDNGDTSIINLGKKVRDEMVIIIYSKNEMKNLTITKEEETKQIENCTNNTVIKNDGCIEKENLNEIISNNQVNNNEIISDTPVKILISINKATKEELMTLSGIGESKANNIISYRNENGNFKTLEEIKNVKGIGDSIFEKIKSNITL